MVSLPVRASICVRQTEILLPRYSTIDLIEANLFASIFMYHSFVGLYFAYAYTNKIKTSVSFETTTTLVSSWSACSMIHVSASLWLDLKIISENSLVIFHLSLFTMTGIRILSEKLSDLR